VSVLNILARRPVPDREARADRPEDILEDRPEDILEHMPEDILEDMAEDILEDMPEEILADIAEDIRTERRRDVRPPGDMHRAGAGSCPEGSMAPALDRWPGLAVLALRRLSWKLHFAAVGERKRRR
jgi:hypothetical protein